MYGGSADSESTLLILPPQSQYNRNCHFHVSYKSMLSMFGLYLPEPCQIRCPFIHSLECSLQHPLQHSLHSSFDYRT